MLQGGGTGDLLPRGDVMIERRCSSQHIIGAHVMQHVPNPRQHAQSSAFDRAVKAYRLALRVYDLIGAAGENGNRRADCRIAPLHSPRPTSQGNNVFAHGAEL